MLETSTNIYVLGFLEAGNAWNDIKNFNPFDLKRSAGVEMCIRDRLYMRLNLIQQALGSINSLLTN